MVASLDIGYVFYHTKVLKNWNVTSLMNNFKNDSYMHLYACVFVVEEKT